MVNTALPIEWEPGLPGDWLRTANVELVIQAGISTSIDVLNAELRRVEPLLDHQAHIFYQTSMPPRKMLSTDW
jgi:hypothetical protein